LLLGWAVGIAERYITHNNGSDQFVGRVAAGLDLTAPSFASLPPHFNNRLVITKDMWKLIVPDFDHLTETFHGVLPYLLASVTYHYEWLLKTLPPRHEFRTARIFADNIIQKWNLCEYLEAGIIKNEATGLTATGVPPHILSLVQGGRIEKKVDTLCTAQDNTSKQLSKLTAKVTTLVNLLKASANSTSGCHYLHESEGDMDMLDILLEDDECIPHMHPDVTMTDASSADASPIVNPVRHHDVTVHNAMSSITSPGVAHGTSNIPFLGSAIPTSSPAPYPMSFGTGASPIPYYPAMLPYGFPGFPCVFNYPAPILPHPSIPHAHIPHGISMYGPGPNIVPPQASTTTGNSPPQQDITSVPVAVQTQESQQIPADSNETSSPSTYCFSQQRPHRWNNSSWHPVQEDWQLE
jgi:hypothetical protein